MNFKKVLVLVLFCIMSIGALEARRGRRGHRGHRGGGGRYHRRGRYRRGLHFRRPYYRRHHFGLGIGSGYGYGYGLGFGYGHPYWYDPGYYGVTYQVLVDPGSREDYKEVRLKAIHRAAKEGDLSTVRRLAAVDDDLINSYYKGKTMLHRAVVKGRYKVARWLVFNDVDLNAPTRGTRKGRWKKIPKGSTALHIAFIKGHQKMIDLLAEAGAQKDIQNKEGKVPSDY